MEKNATGKEITLKSSDGEVFQVPEEVAKLSQTICQIIEDDWDEGSIPLPNVTGQILSKVIDFCKKRVEVKNASKNKTTEEGSTFAQDSSKPSDEEALKDWDKEFLDVEQPMSTLFDLILAANYLNIQGLLDMTCQKVADMMKGKSTEEIRKTFNIKNDFSPEEEEEIRRENQWAFD